MCGACCRAIAFPHTKAALRRLVARREVAGDNLASARFILRHWRRISVRAAAATVPGLVPERGYRYYRCSKLTGDLCADHENRPPICRGFPYYESPPTTNVDDRLGWPGCGYHSSPGACLTLALSSSDWTRWASAQRAKVA
jgi:Fe-S-cluster containining protein